jgi:hypothetical protein
MSVVDTSIQDLPLRQPDSRQDGFVRTIVDFLHDFQHTIFDTYRPERHYMRGPGPACAAKRAERR